VISVDKENFIAFLRLLSEYGIDYGSNFWHLSDKEKQNEIISKLPLTRVGRTLDFDLIIHMSLMNYLAIIDGKPTRSSVLFPEVIDVDRLESAIFQYIQEKERVEDDSDEDGSEKYVPTGLIDALADLILRYENIDPRDEALWDVGSDSCHELLRGKLYPGQGNEDDERFLCDIVWRIFHLRMISEKCADFSPEERASVLFLESMWKSMMEYPEKGEQQY
jgi:hypothetical protein